jgi:hypothetical protein
MAVVNVAALGVWTAQSKNNARQGRALLQALFQNIDSTPLNGVRSGVISTVGSSSIADGLVSFVAGQQLAVQPFSGIAHRTGQGPYLGWLASVANPSVDTPPASNPRNDIVIARFYDAAQGDTVPGAGANPMQIEIVTGTPAASPTDPVTMNTLGVITSGMGAGGGIGIPLARAQVSTGGTITITDLRRSAGVAGSVRRLLPGDSDSLGARGDLRMNSNVLEAYSTAGVWTPIADASGVYPRGTVGYTALLSGTSVTATSEVIQPETCTASVVSGRRYRVNHVRNEANGTGAPILTKRYRVASGASVTTGGTLIDTAVSSTLGGAYTTVNVDAYWVATFTGQATFGVGALITAGTTAVVDSSRNRVVHVEDVGL